MRMASGCNFTLSVRVNVTSAPSDAVIPTAPVEVGSLSVPRNMATTARKLVFTGRVRRTSTDAEENCFTKITFCENTAEVAMLFSVSPAGTKTLLPSLMITSSATSSKAKSLAVWLVSVSVCVSPWPKEPFAMMTAGLREMEGGADTPSCCGGNAGATAGSGGVGGRWGGGGLSFSLGGGRPPHNKPAPRLARVVLGVLINKSIFQLGL